MNNIMSDIKTEEPSKKLVLEYELDAAPEKVWQAISIPEFREKWLPNGVLVDADPVSLTQDEEIHYRIRDDEPPFLESVVTFQVIPNEDGGTLLRIIHKLTDTRVENCLPEAANDNGFCLMCAV
jgi:uncharacterized protein YndB with AHSA1/START domain